MRYSMDYGKVQESGNFEPLPAGQYDVEIVKVKEVKTKNGDPMVKIQYKVVEGADKSKSDHLGKIMFDQVVLFKPDEPGAGITKHFLHVIDEPWDGAVDIDPDNWIGKKLSVSVIVDKAYNNNKVTSRDNFMPF